LNLLLVVISVFWIYVCLVLIVRLLLFFTCCHSFTFTVPVSDSSSLADVILYVYGFCLYCCCGCC
jgi:hypothetical protein